MRLYKTKLQEKLEESLVAVAPVVGIVLVLCFSIAPMAPGILAVCHEGRGHGYQGHCVFPPGDQYGGAAAYGGGSIERQGIGS